MDSSFVDIFDFEFVEGDGHNILVAAGDVVLTQRAAERLFGSEPAVGRSILVNDDWAGTVTGVIAPIRQPSFMGTHESALLRVDLLTGWSTNAALVAQDAEDRWMSNSVFTFAVLPSEMSIRQFNHLLATFVGRRIPDEARGPYDVLVQAIPISEFATWSLETLAVARELAWTPAATLMFLGILVLLIACVNYANLTAAQTLSQAKQAGLRKVLGAGRGQLLTQVFVEALALTFVAAVLAIAILMLAAPAVRNVANVDLLFFLSRGPWSFVLLVGAVIVVAAAAAAWPAWLLSRVRPVEALRQGRTSGGFGLLTRVFVVVQFASASFLLILVTVSQVQRAHLENDVVAARGAPIAVLDDIRSLDIRYDTFRTALADRPGIESVSAVDNVPWRLTGTVIEFSRTPENWVAAPGTFLKWIEFDYFRTLGFDVLAGRVFDSAQDAAIPRLFSAEVSQTPQIVIDAAYAEALGFAEPASAIGETIYLSERIAQIYGRTTQPFTVIGVVETDTTRIQDAGVPGHVFLHYLQTPGASGGPQYPLVRFSPEGVSEGVSAIREVWDELAPGMPLTIQYFDELFERGFSNFSQTSRIFTLLAMAAFLIASTGQLGIAVHVVSQRRHEIGVRKVHGSTTAAIVRLLLAEFARPAIAASIVSWPLAYLAAESYLSVFADRVDLTAGPFLVTTLVTAAIACLAVTSEIVKASAVRPAEVLRHA